MSDAVLQELIVRLASDEGFASSVRAQPTMLDAYDLNDDERAMLLGLGADAGPGASGLAERQSKSSLLFMGAGHHVEGHVHLGHTQGLVNPGPIQHDPGSISPGPQQHDLGPMQHDIKLHEGTLGAGKDPVPIQHDAKIHDGLGKDKLGSLGADKWHTAGKDPVPIQHDAKIHDGLGKDKLGSLGADKWHTAGKDPVPIQHDAKVSDGLGADKGNELGGLGADKGNELGGLGADKLGSLGADKLGFTGGVKIDTELGGGG